MILRVLLTACVFSCLSFKAEGQSTNNYLRVGAYDLSPDNHLVLIGTDESLKVNPAANTLNAELAGFKSVDGKDIQHLDPKFLITMTKNGIQLTYSFDLGKIKTKDGVVVAQ